MKDIIKRWLGINELDFDIKQIQSSIYDEDSLLQGFAVPKFVEKKTILFGGKKKKVR